ncbi:MAG TPA: cation:proton antiporter [Candidatus Paceibacterota bacterium]|nr:cation:proton antiporter [Candidatus Paceibacterota bacterium]
MQILTIVPIILIVAFVFGELFKRVGLPSVIGQIIAGILFGVPMLEAQLFGDASTLIIVDFLATLGILLLLFLAGLEIDIEKVKETSRDSILVSFSSALLPFVLGFGIITIFFPEYGVLTAMIFGGALMVTSEATKVRVLMDLNSLNTRLGAVMVAAGAIDDVFEVLFLSIVIVMAKGGSYVDLARIPLEILVFVVIAFLSFKVISKVLHYVDRNSGDETELFSIAMIFILVLAALSESLNVGYLIGAIIGGFLLQVSMKGISRRHKSELITEIKLVALGFIVPFFFVSVGLNLDASTVFSNIPLVAITVLVAFLGKIAGTLIVKPLSSLSWTQLYYVGWAMNSRGAAELVIALVAVQYGLIPPEIYSALVAMSLITTLTFPPVLARGIHRNPGLMDAKN